MPTTNDVYQRLLFRHATDVEGYEEELVAVLIDLLDRTEEDLVLQIRLLLERLEVQGRSMTPARQRRLESMLVKIRELREKAWTEYNGLLRQQLFSFATDEVRFGQQAFVNALGLEGITLAAPSSTTLRAAVFGQPFRLNENTARTLAEYMASIRKQDTERILTAIRIGYIEGQSVDDIVKRIRGTRAGRYRDGILQISKNHSETIVRTSLNHFANTARASLWEENDDYVLGTVWTSVLDGRTTLICQSRDGRVAPLPGKTLSSKVKLPRLNPPDARPPAHAKCRSILVALLSYEGLIGSRPFVVELGTGKRTDFKSSAERLRWAEKRIGRVPSTVRYEEFVRGEDFAFQKRVYGATRAKLLRDGGLSPEDFVSRNGRRYTLEVLSRLNAEAFKRAGLNV